VGIIPLEELFSKTQKSEGVDDELVRHISGDQRSILVTMGSSGDKNLFLRVLKILDALPYSVIAVVGNIVAEDELPSLSEKIVVRQFVPSIDLIHRMVDLSIIHGGQGTVYAAAYAGKPVIGFPMQFEQHLNLEKLVGHGMGLMLSRWHFSDQDLQKAIQTIFSNYSHYLDKAQKLAHKLPPPQGDVRTADRIIQLCTSFGLIKNKHVPTDTTSSRTR
jgi:UDP:flavonoid glycosyltransferase YjiC (YdhE family)